MKPSFLALSLLLLLHSYSQITISNTALSVNIDAKPVMYYNIDNPVVICTGRSKNATITVKNGSIRKGDAPGKYFIRHKPTDEYNPTITVVIKTKKKLEEYEFFLRPIPFAPKLELAGYNYRAVAALKSTSGLLAYMKNFTFPISFQVDSFSVTFKDSLSSVTYINKGAAWDAVSRSYIDKAKSDSFIIVNGAWLKGTSDTFYVKEEVLYYIPPAKYF